MPAKPAAFGRFVGILEIGVSKFDLYCGIRVHFTFVIGATSGGFRLRCATTRQGIFFVLNGYRIRVYPCPSVVKMLRVGFDKKDILR